MTLAWWDISVHGLCRLFLCKSLFFCHIGHSALPQREMPCSAFSPQPAPPHFVLFKIEIFIFSFGRSLRKERAEGDAEWHGKGILLVLRTKPKRAQKKQKKKMVHGDGITMHTHDMHGLSRRVINLLACRFGAWWWIAASLWCMYTIRSDRVNVDCVFNLQKIYQTFWLVIM